MIEDLMRDVRRQSATTKRILPQQRLDLSLAHDLLGVSEAIRFVIICKGRLAAQSGSVSLTAFRYRVSKRSG